MRKMVTVRKIANIEPIKGADRIEVATVDGWEVVVKKGEYQIGDLVYYFEIDSFLPAGDERWDFLEQRGRKTMMGREGYRLRTIRLRKQISQGLLLPVPPENLEQAQVFLDEETDVSYGFGVVKYERDEKPGCGNGKPKGSFPWFIPKTDEERVQNVFGKYQHKYPDVEFTPTLKLDGSSITVFCDVTGKYTGEEGYLGVCSRNLEVKDDEENRFWMGARNSGILSFTKDLCETTGGAFAVQGELMGPGIQGNREKLEDYTVFVFSIYDIANQKYLPWSEVQQLCYDYGVQSVPVVGDPLYITDFDSVKEVLDMAEGSSIINPVREGIVFKGVQQQRVVTFKAISNKFLLEGGE